jgi:hypothetical protein
MMAAGQGWVKAERCTVWHLLLIIAYDSKEQQVVIELAL